MITTILWSSVAMQAMLTILFGMVAGNLISENGGKGSVAAILGIAVATASCGISLAYVAARVA